MQDSQYFVPYHIPWIVGPLYIILSGSPWCGTDLEVVACCILPLVWQMNKATLSISSKLCLYISIQH